jgi:hypothetical protein
MAEFPWEAELRETIREELESLCATSIRPTTDQERREFIKLAQLGYIDQRIDNRVDAIPWVNFPKRLVADVIRQEARYASLWARFEEQDRGRVKLERELTKLKAKKGRAHA